MLGRIIIYSLNNADGIFTSTPMIRLMLCLKNSISVSLLHSLSIANGQSILNKPKESMLVKKSKILQMHKIWTVLKSASICEERNRFKIDTRECHWLMIYYLKLICCCSNVLTVIYSQWWKAIWSNWLITS